MIDFFSRFRTVPYRRATFFFLLLFLLLFLLSIFAVRSAGFFENDTAPNGRPSKVHSVLLTKEGFSPERLEIHSGDSVVFSSDEERAFWPASDPHPSHGGYAGFDAKKALQKGEEWSFLFSEAGVWRYHDHLSPSVRGEIVVLGTGREGAESCTYEKAGSGDAFCFEELVRSAMERGGVEAGWTVFQGLFEGGAVPRSCHWTAHLIGEEAYALYKAGKEVPLSKATSYCGFGFYHGFLESLLREDPDPKVALRFCEQVEEKLGSTGLQNCYHGIGHGYTEDPPDPSTIGDFKGMVKPGIKMCEFLFGENFTHLNLCLTGVFTVPAGFAAEGKYGLSISTNDPFSYCKGEPYRYLKACYGEFAPKLDEILHWDLSHLPTYIDDIHDDKLRRLVTWVVPSVMIAHDIFEEDHAKYITGCRIGFGSPLREICWGGTILGFFQHGEPEKQYEKALKFCESEAWAESERPFCYGETFHRLRSEYAPEKVDNLCGAIPSRYRYLCAEGSHRSPYDDPSFETP